MLLRCPSPVCLAKAADATSSLARSVPRYTFFIVLYPMGVSGELLTIYGALPYVQKTGLYSVTLPNKYNFSFDYHTFLILVMISYIPRKSPPAAAPAECTHSGRKKKRLELLQTGSRNQEEKEKWKRFFISCLLSPPPPQCSPSFTST